MVGFGFGTASLGKGLFNTLTWLSLAATLSVGMFFTSDCLSEEKREGTIGFLFLTDLRGYDIVLGRSRRRRDFRRGQAAQFQPGPEPVQSRLSLLGSRCVGPKLFLARLARQSGICLAAFWPDLPVAPEDLAGKGCKDLDGQWKLGALVEIRRGKTPCGVAPKAGRRESRAVAGVPRALAGGLSLGGGNSSGEWINRDIRERRANLVVCVELFRWRLDIGVVLGRCSALCARVM